MNPAAPFYALSPQEVLDALDVLGLRTDGRILALNSYENRVYQVGREEQAPVVAKFYRPNRWSDAAIREEHAFALELAAAEIPVVPPLMLEGETLHQHRGFRYAVFERRGGRWPELGRPDEREWVGRFLGRIHAMGRARPFRERARLSLELLGEAPREFVLESGFLPEYLAPKYAQVTEDILQEIEAGAVRLETLQFGRILGDCHRGNILWTDAGPHFVDLDDCLSGPAVQDLWMLLAGPAQEMSVQLTDILKGYEQFTRFDRRELAWIEPLRALRMIHYAAWLARRWDDPAFPRAFPWFSGPRYWEEHQRALEEQLEVLRAPSLEL